MIDLHTHLLPGIDDGPRTIEQSIALAAEMVAEGVTVAACTPHVRDDYGTTAQSMEAALAELRSRLEQEGIALDVRGGGEIALDRLPALDPGTRARFGLAGNPRLLLLEFPFYGWPLALPSIVENLKAEGIVALFAHPERNSEVQEQPERLEPLVEQGAYVQLTAGSLDGTAGARAGRCARALLDAELAHVVASDRHGPSIARTSLLAGRAAIGDEPLARWLTESAPKALLESAPLPPRPARQQPSRRPTRRLWRRG